MPCDCLQVETELTNINRFRRNLLQSTVKTLTLLVIPSGLQKVKKKKKATCQILKTLRVDKVTLQYEQTTVQRSIASTRKKTCICCYFFLKSRHLLNVDIFSFHCVGISVVDAFDNRCGVCTTTEELELLVK